MNRRSSGREPESGDAVPGEAPRPPWRGFALAAAAALLIGIGLPWILRPGPLLVSAQVVRPSESSAPASGLRSGDEFCLDLELGGDAAILVVFVGSDAAFAILEPSPGTPVRVYEEGEAIRIPCQREGRAWRLDDSPGTERLIVAAFPADETPRGPVVERLSREAAEAGPDPVEVATTVMRILMVEGAEVSLLPVEHLPRRGEPAPG